MKFLKKFSVFILALSVFFVSILAIAQPMFASRSTHRLMAQFMPIIPAKIALLIPKVSPQTMIKPALSLNQISATLAPTWTTDHSHAQIRECNCPQCQLTV